MQRQTGPSDVDKALNELSLRDARRRGDAAVTLGVFGDERALEKLKALVGDRSEYVRVSVHYALALLGEKSSLKALLAYADHERKRFRKLAVAVLREATGVASDTDADDAEVCKEAAKTWETWWKDNEAKLKFDREKKRYVLYY